MFCFLLYFCAVNAAFLFIIVLKVTAAKLKLTNKLRVPQGDKFSLGRFEGLPKRENQNPPLVFLLLFAAKRSKKMSKKTCKIPVNMIV